MPRCKGFQALVRVDGKALEEYAVDTKDDSATSWIVSEEGQTFDVVLKFEEPDVFCAADLEVEGIPVSRRTRISNERKKLKWVGKRVSDTAIRTFQFSRINIIDDESQVLRASSNPTRSIIIRIFRIEKKKKKKGNGVLRRLPQRALVEDSHDLDANVEVFEKAKILNPHVISFSRQTLHKKRSRPSRHSSSHTPIDEKDQPFFTFKMSYGPREFLRAQGIIPRDQGLGREPSSPPNESEDEDSSTTLQELERRKAEVDRQQAELQREIDKRRGLGGAVVKKEAKPAISFIPGEVIDLTDD